MKKIPTLFQRTFGDHKVIGITDEVTPGLEWVLEGEGVATVKFDGSCCRILNGELWKRYDAKKGKTPPEGAVPCCDPDSVTGHWPHWVKCDPDNPADKWFMNAYTNSLFWSGHYMQLQDGTYEAVGPQFQGNPYNLKLNSLIKHGVVIISNDRLTRTYDDIRKYLSNHEVEGIVFWKDGEPKCKIKRTDFGFEWPIKNFDPRDTLKI